MKQIAIGTVQFGKQYGVANKHGQVSLSEAKEILHLAKSNGIDTIDTAIAYGDSERVLGTIGVDGWKVVTKLPAIDQETENLRSLVKEKFQGSLDLLKVNSVYALLLHRPEDLLSGEGQELYDSLLELKTSGMIQKIGISIYDPADVSPIIKKFKIDLLQCPFNVLDRRLVESGLLSWCIQNKVEVHVRSIFLQGLLLMDKNLRPEKFNRWKKIWDEFESWTNTKQITALEACILFVRSVKGIDKVIIGLDSLNQLSEILDVLNNRKNVSVPESFASNDPLLINPFNWSNL